MEWRSGGRAVPEEPNSRIHVTRDDASPPILLLTNAAQPSPDWTHAIRLRGLEFDHTTATTLDLTEAHWVKHPEEPAQLCELADYERNAAEVRTSWIDAFTYKREDVERNLEGLRPPQIGAIHAVQAHWTVHTEPATVVLPTGDGKTEAMLSLLVAERCQRLMVVVPTDALRTQIAEKFLLLGLLKTPRSRSFPSERSIPWSAFSTIGRLILRR